MSFKQNFYKCPSQITTKFSCHFWDFDPSPLEYKSNLLVELLISSEFSFINQVIMLGTYI
jgi:hypothetical protein